MVKRVLFLLTVVFFTSISAQAQEDYRKFEFWGTYTLLVADIDILDNESLHGYGFGAQGNINKYFGLVGEFTSTHGASGPITIIPPTPPVILIPELDTRVNTFLFGPRVSYRTKPVTLFAHVLLGGANTNLEDEQGTSGFDESNTEFAMAIGGGIDINIGSRFAIRAAQFDYLPVHTDINERLTGGSSSWLQNTRFQTGAVFKF
jgi:opacity protein-like surface antigen